MAEVKQTIVNATQVMDRCSAILLQELSKKHSMEDMTKHDDAQLQMAREWTQNAKEPWFAIFLYQWKSVLEAQFLFAPSGYGFEIIGRGVSDEFQPWILIIRAYDKYGGQFVSLSQLQSEIKACQAQIAANEKLIKVLKMKINHIKHIKQIKRELQDVNLGTTTPTSSTDLPALAHTEGNVPYVSGGQV